MITSVNAKSAQRMKSLSARINPFGDFNPYLTHINEDRVGQIVSNHIKRKNAGIAIIPGF